jgi:stage II sporulation protein D
MTSLCNIIKYSIISGSLLIFSAEARHTRIHKKLRPTSQPLLFIHTNKIDFLRLLSLFKEPLLDDYSMAKTVALLMPSASAQSQHNFVQQHQSFKVRVLLDQQVTTLSPSWQLTSQEGFLLISADGEAKVVINQPVLAIKIYNGKLFVNGKQARDNTCTIIPRHGPTKMEDKYYHGSFGVVHDRDKLCLINYIDLEEYVSCVLNAESWPGWPLELNKAFAIACRSYVVTKIKHAVAAKKVFHIKNTNIHQTYNGVHASQALGLAVEQTRGLVLAHNREPVEAMFDCCCGGIIPAYMAGVDFKRAPYLARSYQCTYCKSCKLYAWKVDYSVSSFERLLKDAGIPVWQLREIAVSKRDKAGIVHEVRVRDARKVIHLSGKQVYSLCSKIKSFYFSVEKKGKQISFTGKGYGHHLGICQWGARRMIDAGFSHRSILQFYYPGTKLTEFRYII